MKVKLFIPLVLLGLLLCPDLMRAASPLTDYEKRYTETYDVNDNARVKLDNRYGNIKVVAWNQQRVKVDILVTVEASSQEDFEDVLERIDIDISGSNSSVTATTSIGNNSGGNSWWKFITGGGSSSDDFKINYTISMPAGLYLDTHARYCDVDLPDLSGETILNVGYGDLVAGRLTGRSEVSISYGSARVEEVGDNSTIRFRYSNGTVRKGGDIQYDGRYSEIRFGNIGDVRLDIGYDEVDIETAGEIRLDGNYNEFTVEQAESVYLDGNYTDFDLGTVSKVLEVDAAYGEVEVDRLSAGFERVNIRVSYTDVEIDVDDGAGYTLDLSARYGDIDVPRDDLSPRNISSEGSTDSVTGTKAGSGSGEIRIETSYGDIEIY